VTPLPGHPRNAGIYDMARDSRGRLIVAGEVTPGNDEEWDVAGIVLGAFRPNGTLDRSFGREGFSDAAGSGASGVAVLPDQRIVAVGFTNRGNSPALNWHYGTTITRFNSDGSPDESLSGNGHAEGLGGQAGRDVVVQANGRIVVAGIKTQYYQSVGLVAGLKPNGRLDPTFGKNGHIAVFAPRSRYHYSDLSDIVIQPDGKLLIAGRIEGRILLQRLLPNGRPDRVFGGGDGRVAVQFSPRGCECSAAHAVRVQSDGRIVVLAHEDRVRRAVIVTRFLADGRLDSSFGRSGRGFVRYPNSYALGLAIQQNDKIVVAGRSGRFATRQFMVLRYLGDGEPDSHFGVDGAWLQKLGDKSEATSILVQPDGRVVVAGHSVKAHATGNVKSFLLQRFLP